MVDEAEKSDALFVNLVKIFQGAAMQEMGKFINPLTGKVEKNLERARFSIDTLAMLREKTRGNLSEDIERLLDSTLLNLRMNYVEEAAAEGPAEASPGGEAPAGEGPEPSRQAEPADTIPAGKAGGTGPGGSGETVTEEVTNQPPAKEGGSDQGTRGGGGKAAPGAKRARRKSRS